MTFEEVVTLGMALTYARAKLNTRIQKIEKRLEEKDTHVRLKSACGYLQGGLHGGKFGTVETALDYVNGLGCEYEIDEDRGVLSPCDYSRLRSTFKICVFKD